MLSLLTFAVIAVAGGLWFLQSSHFRTFLAGYLSEKSQREVTLEGDTHIDYGRIMRFSFDNVMIGNAPWAGEAAMLKAGNVTVAINLMSILKGDVELPEVVLVSPEVNLARDKDGKANWQLGQDSAGAVVVEAATPDERGDMPIIGRIQVDDGKLTFKDAQRDLNLTMTLSTVRGKADDDTNSESVKLQGKGTLKGRPLSFHITGGSVLALKKDDEPYPFSFNLQAVDTSIEVRGTAEDPFKLEGLDLTMKIRGSDAADLFHITGIALPPTPPYTVAGHLTRDGERWIFNDFDGTLGESDIHGDVVWNKGQEPPLFSGTMTSNLLDMEDLKGLIGAKDDPVDDGLVIPDTPLDISRLRAMNADVSFKGKQIKTGYALDNFAMKVNLTNGVLRLEPVSFGVAHGTINANIVINGRKEVPHTTADITFRRLSLAQLFEPLARRFGEENVTAGIFGGKARLEGEGKSLRQMLGTSDGEVGISMEGGQLSRMLLELVGLDFFKFAGLLASGDRPVEVSCVVGDFGVENGLMRARELLMDTNVTTLRGEGALNLKNEAIDMRVKVYPKDVSLLSARTPILIGGTLGDPSVGLDPAALAARGGAAAALGALLTPVASLLAFLEPGMGKDSNCIQFVRSMEDRGATVSTQAHGK